MKQVLTIAILLGAISVRAQITTGTEKDNQFDRPWKLIVPDTIRPIVFISIDEKDFRYRSDYYVCGFGNPPIIKKIPVDMIVRHYFGISYWD